MALVNTLYMYMTVVRVVQKPKQFPYQGKEHYTFELEDSHKRR